MLWIFNNGHDNRQLQTQIINMKTEDAQYSISDLSRALLREFLSQKGLKKTLQAFEKEDVRNKKKINKNLLIEMLSLKSLFLLNKQARDAKTSLLQILVTYLNKKYQVKKNNFVTTQPNASFPKLEDALQTQKIESLHKNKERPSSSKPFKSYELESGKHLAGPLREKQELKVIYQKLSKKQDSKQFRIVQSNALKKEPSKISEKAAHLEEQQSVQPFKNKVLQIEDEYKQEFEQPEGKQPDLVIKTQIKSEEKKVNSDNIKNKYIPNFAETPIQKVQEISKNRIEKSQPGDEKVTSNPIIQKQQRVSDKKIIETKQKGLKAEKPNDKMTKSNSQQYINPTPILHIQSRPLQLQKEDKDNMGSSASVAKKEEYIVEQPKQQPQKIRTQMRLIGKKRQASSKNIQVIEEKKQIAKLTAQEQPKKQEKISEHQKLVQISKQDVGSKKQFEINKKMETVSNNAAPAQKMVTLNKKRKGKQQVSDASYPTKFKFDENFTHQIPKELTYEYKQNRFEPLTIIQNASQLYPNLIFNATINYKQKGGGIPPVKKKLEKLIASKDAERLKKIVFQSSPPVLPKSWAQGFILSPHEQTPYGLRQIQGGPCGIIAAMQCYFLKHLLYCSGQSEYNDENLRQMCLAAAITDMLWKVKSADKFLLAFPPKGASKVEISNLRTTVIDATDFASAFAGIWSIRDQYIGNTNHGVAALLYSVVLTKGIELIESEMDIKENPLIGNHGHCTQQFVNLILTGKASSNCFDGQKILDDYKLKGITSKSQFGFLTIFEALKYLQVGKNLKNPIFPVWVICKQFHYHVIFASHYLISECNNAPKIDIVYFDGLYNCGDRIRITLQSLKQDQEDNVKLKDLPLIEQVMMTKWGRRISNWNGSTRIL